jgi:hypothetical protein
VRARRMRFGRGGDRASPVSMRRWANRTLVVVTVAAALYAGVFAVRSALDATSSPPVAAASAVEATVSSQTVSFGHDRVVTRVKPGGAACFKALKGSSKVASACFGALAADAIVYASSPTAVAGRAGPLVKAVIVRVTGKGTVWAQLKRGAFYAALPKGRRATKVIKVLKGGTRQSFTVTG